MPESSEHQTAIHFLNQKLAIVHFFPVSKEHYSESSKTWNNFWEIVTVFLLLKIHRVGFLN